MSRESVEAIKFVYPNLYHRIVQGVMEKIEKKPEDVSYEQRLILGTLLDAPTDLALQPAALSKFQSYYKEAQESQAGGAVAPKKGLSAAAISGANTSVVILRSIGISSSSVVDANFMSIFWFKPMFVSTSTV